MKQLFGQNNEEPKTLNPGDADHAEVAENYDGMENAVIVIQPYLKYNLDFYYIAPFYHTIFPGIEKLIALDLDLEFRCSLSSLYQQFSLFSGSELIGLAPDLNFHYHLQAAYYKDNNPDSMVGTPGRWQGFNTGVALYNLANMRASKV